MLSTYILQQEQIHFDLIELAARGIEPRQQRWYDRVAAELAR